MNERSTSIVHIRVHIVLHIHSLQELCIPLSVNLYSTVQNAEFEPVLSAHWVLGISTTLSHQSKNILTHQSSLKLQYSNINSHRRLPLHLHVNSLEPSESCSSSSASMFCTAPSLRAVLNDSAVDIYTRTHVRTLNFNWSLKCSMSVCVETVWCRTVDVSQFTSAVGQDSIRNY